MAKRKWKKLKPLPGRDNPCLCCPPIPGMAKSAEALIAVWDGKSKGTKHMIDLAMKSGLEIYISNGGFA